MAIMSIARWKFQPARVAEGFENAKKAKEMFLANGAESVEWGSVLAGTGPGEWAMFIRIWRQWKRHSRRLWPTRNLPKYSWTRIHRLH